MVEFYTYQYSTSHLFFPKIIITILIVLGAIIWMPRLIQAVKTRSNGAERKRFFVEGYDIVKFYGSILFLILYVLALELVGFLPASILFIFLFNVLFTAALDMKSILISATISIVASVGVWYIFGVLFNVTLP